MRIFWSTPIGSAVSLAAMLTVGVPIAVSAVPAKKATPARKAQPVKRPAVSEPALSMKTAPGAPFAKVVVEIAQSFEECGRLGCSTTISGITAAGKTVDITFDEILTNSNPGTRAEVFGSYDANGMPYIVLEQGLINGGVSFNLFAYKPALRRYSFIKDVSGYAGGKIGAVAPGTSQPQAAARPAAMPAQISYAGPSRYKGVEVIQDLELAFEGSLISGYSAGQLFGRVIAVPITGTYESGTCKVKLKGDTLSGPCDRRGFSGSRLSKKGEVVGSFEFANADDLPPVSSYSQGQPAVAPVEPAVVNSGVWSLGRARFLVEPRGGCGPQVSLGTKSYCFNQAMDWLRRHPDRQSVDVVAMQNSWLPGSFVPHNSGQGWNIYKVSKQGDAFTAQKQQHYGTKVQVPQGCIYAGVAGQAWYIAITRRGKVAVEAANYSCSNLWAGRSIYAANLNTQDTDFAPSEVQISDGAGQSNQGGPQPAYAAQRFQNNENGMAMSAQKDDYLYGTSAMISGVPDTGAAPAKPKRKRKK